MKPIIEAIELQNNDNLLLIDARGGADAYQRYLHGHLKGALFIDLDKDLAAKPADAAVGGRHPLPDLNQFADLLGGLGITPQTHVVIYDDKAGANPAARFWWMLKAVGHEKVQVLNGGLQAAVDHKLPLDTKPETPVAAEPYPVPENYAGTVDIEEVKEAVKDQNRIVIDVREAARYKGYTEPLDLIAGHIPGAVNIPYANNLDADHKYLPQEQLSSFYKEKLGDVKPENVVVHCGSGVTACHTLLALEEAGIKGAKLYVGSWSEWSRRDLPMVRTSSVN